MISVGYLVLKDAINKYVMNFLNSFMKLKIEPTAEF